MSFLKNNLIFILAFLQFLGFLKASDFTFFIIFCVTLILISLLKMEKKYYFYFILFLTICLPFCIILHLEKIGFFLGGLWFLNTIIFLILNKFSGQFLKE